MPDKPRGAMPPTVERFFSAKPSSYDAQAHTVDMVAYSGARVQRWYGMLELAMDDASVDLSRVANGGLPLLDSHNPMGLDAKLGTVTSVQLVGGQLHARARFDGTDAAKAVEERVARGEIGAVSIGFSIHPDKFEMIGETDGGSEIWRAGGWTLNEISLVTVPADANAGVLSAHNPSGEKMAAARQKGTDMTEEEKRAAEAAAKAAADKLAADKAHEDALAAAREKAVGEERLRVKTIRERVAKVGLGEDFAAKMIDDGVSVEKIGDKIVDELAASGHKGGGNIRVGVDNKDPAVIAERMSVALAAQGTQHLPEKLRVPMKDEAREFASFGILDMFAELARAKGEKIEFGIQRNRARLYDRLAENFAMSTSDFPLLLAAAANKMLLPAYQAAAPTFFRIAKRVTFNDFKAHHFLRIGDFPNLLQTGETGEIKEGGISESDQTVTAITYGRTVSITRRIIVNDDLSAFSEIPAMAAIRSAQVANAAGFNLFALNSNAGPNITEGGVATAMWATGHNNLTGTGTAISVDSLGVARATMRKQTGLDGVKINIAPSILLTSPDKENLAFQYTSSAYVPNQSNVINPFAGKLEPIADANLSGNAWYLFADPAVAPVFVYGYVAGYEGPRMTTKEGFSTDGVKLRCMLDLGVGGIDYRGTYKNAGA